MICRRRRRKKREWIRKTWVRGRNGKKICVKGHIALWGTWGMNSGFYNVGFFHISVSSISSAPLTAGSHFYTCRNESVMRLGGREDRALPRMVCTRTLTSLIEYSSLFQSIFHRKEIEVNSERIMASIFPQSLTPDELNVKFSCTRKLFFLKVFTGIQKS